MRATGIDLAQGTYASVPIGLHAAGSAGGVALSADGDRGQRDARARRIHCPGVKVEITNAGGSEVDTAWESVHGGVSPAG